MEGRAEKEGGDRRLEAGAQVGGWRLEDRAERRKPRGEREGGGRRLEAGAQAGAQVGAQAGD